MEFILVTGMSGAGKSKTVEALEDQGYFCVDNVPPQMLPKFVELNRSSDGYAEKMTVVVDARSQEAFADFNTELQKLTDSKTPFRLLFLDASDTVLLNRFKEKRRKHPLMSPENGNSTIQEALDKERAILQGIRQQADYIIDTSHVSPAQLKKQIAELFSPDSGRGMLVQVMSFGFKYGAPMEADLVFDVRCLPNPFYVPELREHTGLEAAVRGYVMQAPESKELLHKLLDLLDFLYPLYVAEGKTRLVVAMGCTGGKHRSVAFAEAIREHFAARDIPVAATHRDKDKSGRPPATPPKL